MKQKILLTFILPCYNVEKYVQECLDSIYGCNLSEDQFEVLCINDCSLDNTQEILELNQKKHSNLRILVHESNRGPGEARNTGIREAKGKYLWFVDSDDVVDASRLSELLQKMSEQEMDMSCFNYRCMDVEGKELSIDLVFPFKDTEVSDGFAFAASVFGLRETIYYMVYAWRFLFRTDYVRDMNLFFPERVAYEETVFLAKAVLNAKRIAAFSNVMYFYRITPEGITQSGHRSRSAKLIYDASFGFGGRLLEFSNEINDEEMKESIRQYATCHSWLNGYGINLLRTSRAERKKFFQLVREKREEIGYLKEYLSMFNRILFLPIVGPWVAEIGSVMYKLKHRQK